MLAKDRCLLHRSGHFLYGQHYPFLTSGPVHPYYLDESIRFLVLGYLVNIFTS